jgi:pimeloyl-ACP methyl ester carboxylesterase
VGEVFRRRGGPALLVSPMAVDEPMKRAMPILWTFDARGFIGTVRVPALVIAGSDDPVVPLARVRAVRDAIVGSELVVAEGGGHVPTVAHRADVARAAAGFLGARDG